jgi:hypothetical protein
MLEFCDSFANEVSQGFFPFLVIKYSFYFLLLWPIIGPLVCSYLTLAKFKKLAPSVLALIDPEVTLEPPSVLSQEHFSPLEYVYELTGGLPISGVHNKLFASWTRLKCFLNYEILSLIQAQNHNSGTSKASWAQEALRIPECRLMLKLHKTFPWSVEY